MMTTDPQATGHEPETPRRMHAECSCGAVLEAADGPAVVAVVREHARLAHGRDLDEALVRAMVRPV